VTYHETKTFPQLCAIRIENAQLPSIDSSPIACQSKGAGIKKKGILAPDDHLRPPN
jgi:hypothetical protein